MSGSMLIVSFFSYLYQVFMARSLGPATYGELGSLLAIFMILAIPVGTIQVVIAKFAARYSARNELGKIGSLMVSTTRKLLIYGLGMFIGIAILSPWIADFLNIDSCFPVIIIGLTIMLSVTLAVNRGILHGMQKFHAFALNNILESAIRFIAGVALVALGLGINGAVIAFSLGFLVSFLFTFIPLKHVFKVRDWNIDVRELYRFTAPVLCVVLIVNLLVNLPTILIKHYYSAEFAGFWNVSLTLGGLIFFVSSSVAIVMFPKVSSTSNVLEKKAIFNKGLSYVVLSSLCISGLFYLFSGEMLVLLFGDAYAGGAVILKWIGLWVSFIAVVQLRLFYELAQKEVRIDPLTYP